MSPGIEIGWQTQITTESRPWDIDMAQAMDSGDVLGSATATLTDLLTGLDYPTGLVGSPVVNGTTVTLVVASLIAGHNYRLVVTGSMGGSKETATALLLACPY